MSETKIAKLETELASVKVELEEFRNVIGKLSREKNELAGTVGTLNLKAADAEQAIKAVHQWIKGQNDSNGRHASTSRF